MTVGGTRESAAIVGRALDRARRSASPLWSGPWKPSWSSFNRAKPHDESAMGHECRRTPRAPAHVSAIRQACSCRLLLDGGGELRPQRKRAERTGGHRVSIPRCRRRVGLAFHHFLGAIGEYYLPEITGAGVGLLDYDGDGDLDVLFVQGDLFDPATSSDRLTFAPPSTHWPGHRLFRNELVSERQAGVYRRDRTRGHQASDVWHGCRGGRLRQRRQCRSLPHQFGSNTLYRNNGDGTLPTSRVQPGVDDPRWSSSAPSSITTGTGSSTSRGQLRRLHRGRQQEVPLALGNARLLQSSRVSRRAGEPVSQ